MPSIFPGFDPAALTFFRQLEKNNNREWFTPRKAKFEELVRRPMLELCGQINDDLRRFSVDHVTEPARAIYRIHRDTRFAKDKSPYKTQLAATFARQGLSRDSGAGFYFSISHAGVEVAAGMYMPEPSVLLAVRQAIAAQEKEFRKLLSAPALKRTMGELQGEKLARVPKGFAAADTAADLLRFKQLYFYVTLPPKTATGRQLRRSIVDRFKLMEPVVRFLNEAALTKLRDDEQDKASRPKRPEPMF